MKFYVFVFIRILRNISHLKGFPYGGGHSQIFDEELILPIGSDLFGILYLGVHSFTMYFFLSWRLDFFFILLSRPTLECDLVATVLFPLTLRLKYVSPFYYTILKCDLKEFSLLFSLQLNARHILIYVLLITGLVFSRDPYSILSSIFISNHINKSSWIQRNSENSWFVAKEIIEGLY